MVASMRGYIRPHPDFSWRVVTVGRESVPVLVIDDFVSNAEQIVEEAAERHPFQPPRTIYPGLRSPAHPAYTLALYRILDEPIRRLFGLGGSEMVHVDCDFRLVTAPPESLTPRQCLPHYDLAKPGIFALLHYLTAGPFGGTSFYRHRSTGFETIQKPREAPFEQSLARELELYRPEGYIVGDNPLFERIASVELKFNRALIYPAALLHSSDTPPSHPYSADPRSGRLTGAAFFHYGLPNRPLPPLTVPTISRSA